MGIKNECTPVVGIVKNPGGTGTTYTVDQSEAVKFRLLNSSSGKVSCPVMSENGKCKGMFPCYVNEADTYTTVVPESVQ